jgi:hypothetical protein
MKTLAKQYIEKYGDSISNSHLTSIARENLADLKSNDNYAWIEFCDDSVLSNNLGDTKAYNKLQRFHKKGIEW